MNKRQASYQFSRAITKVSELYLLLATGFFELAAGKYWFLSQAMIKHGKFDLGTISDLSFAIGSTSIAAYSGIYAYVCTKSRLSSCLDLRKLRKNKEAYPLENAEEIVFDDTQGLEMLLERTRLGEKSEWGTLARIYNNKGKAIVYEILNPEEAEKLKLVKLKSKNRIWVDENKGIEKGYNGVQHYHFDMGPRWFGGRNFAINVIDRKATPINWINLLTFNLPEGPEIIAYNRKHTYIPKGTSKKELIKAKSKQIMEYLRS